MNDLNTSLFPAVSRSITFIKTNIDNQTWPNGTRLPLCRQLAEMAGVAPGSMSKAITVLKQQKLLTARPKAGIFVGALVPVKTITEQVVPKIHRAEIIKRKLKQEILDGTFGDQDKLPTVKELKERYRTGFRPVKKAIDLLVDEDLLIPSKRNFLIRGFTKSSTFNTLYIIMSKKIYDYLLWNIDRSAIESFIQIIEKECYAKNLKIVRSWYPEHFAEHINTKNAAGFIIWISWEIRDKLSEILAPLVSAKKTIAILNSTITTIESGVSENLKGNGRVYLFNHSRFRTEGFNVGRFLYEKGHKKVCYIGYNRNQQWNMERYEGLCNAFSTLNLPKAVIPFFHSDYAHIPLSNNSQLQDSIAKRIDNENTFFSSLTHTLKKHQAFMHSFNERLVTSIEEYLYGISQRKNFTPLFEQIINKRLGSVWVCADDYLANYAALQFLNENHIKIPEHIGIVGFNNQIESAFNGITSYHFNFAETAKKMLNLIMYPEYFKKEEKGKRGEWMFEVDGMVIDRGSV